MQKLKFLPKSVRENGEPVKMRCRDLRIRKVQTFSVKEHLLPVLYDQTISVKHSAECGHISDIMDLLRDLAGNL